MSKYFLKDMSLNEETRFILYRLNLLSSIILL